MSVENPQNRDELIQHCMMRIGAPIIKINVTEMQARLRVKEAIKMFLDYHFDATETAWLRQEITEDMVVSKSFKVPSFVTGVNRVLNIKPNIYADINTLGSSIFAVLNRNLMSNVETMDKVSLYMYAREISEWEEIWRAPPHWQFNKTTLNLSIDTGSMNFRPGMYVMYQAQVDVSQFTGNFFSNDWLIRYTSALIKEQWGENLSKFKNVSLPGGVSYDADGILLEAKKDKEELRLWLYDNASYHNSPISIG